MSLKEALRTFIATEGPYTGPFFMGEITREKISRGVLLRDAGSHNSDPTGFKQFPSVEILILAPDQAEVDQLALHLYGLLNLGRPLQLAPGYRAGRVVVPQPPSSEGRDEIGLWVRALTVNFALHKHAQL